MFNYVTTYFSKISIFKDFRIWYFPCRGFLDFAKKGVPLSKFKINGWFLYASLFLWEENILVCNPGTQTKIGRSMGIFLIPGFWLDSTKTVVTLLFYLSEDFFMPSGSLLIWLYFEPWRWRFLILFPPSWLEIDFKSM